MYVKFLMKRGKLLICAICPLILLSCNTKPDVDYALASRALSAAKAEGADFNECASRNYYEAQRLFKLGEKYYKVKDYSAAIGSLNDSIRHSEKAEEEAVFCEK
jgi:hypothetical protein